jgi:hypothetical protein
MCRHGRASVDDQSWERSWSHYDRGREMADAARLLRGLLELVYGDDLDAA